MKISAEHQGKPTSDNMKYTNQAFPEMFLSITSWN